MTNTCNPPGNFVPAGNEGPDICQLAIAERDNRLVPKVGTELLQNWCPFQYSAFCLWQGEELA